MLSDSSSFQDSLQQLASSFVPFLLALVFHEYGHGWMARRFGDKTATEAGRLTLNPLAHIDPIGTVLFPALNFFTGIPIFLGWARPVPIDPRRFSRLRTGLFMVSLAGPGMNILLAVLCAAAWAGLQHWVPRDFYYFEPLTQMAVIGVMINYSLALFNLLPLPPLDGSKMVQSLLPLRLAVRFERFSRYGFFLLLLMFALGWLKFLGAPIRAVTLLTLYGASTLFGVPLSP